MPSQMDDFDLTIKVEDKNLPPFWPIFVKRERSRKGGPPAAAAANASSERGREVAKEQGERGKGRAQGREEEKGIGVEQRGEGRG